MSLWWRITPAVAQRRMSSQTDGFTLQSAGVTGWPTLRAYIKGHMGTSITVIAAPKERDAALIQSLLDLARVMTIDNAYVCTVAQHVAHYRERLSQLQCRVIPPVQDTRHGVLIQFAMTVFDACSDLHPGSTVVLVSPHPSLGIIGDWLLCHSKQTQVHAVRALTPSTLSVIYGNLSLPDLDAIAIDLAMSLTASRPRIRACNWSDLLIERLPTLQDRTRRQALLGTGRFLTYARMLGLTVDGEDLLAMPQRPHGRPTGEALIALFHSLQSRNRPVLLLVWTRTVLETYPGLQHPGVRSLLFGDERFKKIAQIIGLRVSGNRIYGLTGPCTSAFG